MRLGCLVLSELQLRALVRITHLRAGKVWSRRGELEVEWRGMELEKAEGMDIY